MDNNKLFEHFGEDARDFYTLIQDLQSQAKHIESVILCDIGFNQENILWPEETTDNSPRTPRNKTAVTEGLNFVDNIIPKLAQALSNCKNLQRLTLSDSGLHANIENDDLDKLAGALELHKEFTYMGLYGLLKDQPENNTNLRFLNMVVTACQYLSSLEVGNNGVSTWSSNMWGEIGKIFNRMKKLSNFSLSDESLSDECLEHFCKTIKNISNDALETFSIEWQECPSEEGLEKLGDALSTLKSIRHLKLGIFDDETIPEAINLLKKFTGLKKITLFVSEISDENIDLLRDALIELKIELFVLRLENDFMEEEEYQATSTKLDNDPLWPAHEVEYVSSQEGTKISPFKASPFKASPFKLTPVKLPVFSNPPGQTPPQLRSLLTNIRVRHQQKKTTEPPKEQPDFLANFTGLFTPTTDELPSKTTKQLYFPDSIHDVTVYFFQQLSCEFSSSTKFVNAVNGILPIIEELLEPLTFRVIGAAVTHAQFNQESKAEKKTRLTLATSLIKMQYEKQLLNDSQLARLDDECQNLGSSIVSSTPIKKSRQGTEKTLDIPTPLESLEPQQQEICEDSRESSSHKKSAEKSPKAKTSVCDEIKSTPHESLESQEQETSEDSTQNSSHNKSTKGFPKAKTSVCDETLGSDDYENKLKCIFSNSEDISLILKIVLKLSEHGEQSKTKKDEIHDFIKNLMLVDSEDDFLEFISKSLNHVNDRQKNALLTNTGTGVYWFSNIFSKKHLNPKASENKVKGYKKYSNSSTEDLLIELFDAATQACSAESSLST